MSNLTAEQSLTKRRLEGEVRNLEKNREAYYQVVQDTNDIFLFYFCYHNDDKKSPYYGGYYIGKIVLPKDYPKNPGDFYTLTPSGRFEENKKICLTNSGYHKENWTAMWNISNMVVGFVSIFTSDDTSGISHIKKSPTERKDLAAKSVGYNLSHHKDITLKFTQFFKPDGTIRTDEEIKTWISENSAKKPVKKTVKETTVRVKKTEIDNKPAVAAVAAVAANPAPIPTLHNVSPKKDIVVDNKDIVVDNKDNIDIPNPPVDVPIAEPIPSPKKGKQVKSKSPSSSPIKKSASPIKKPIVDVEAEESSDSDDVFEDISEEEIAHVKKQNVSVSTSKKSVKTTAKPVAKPVAKPAIKPVAKPAAKQTIEKEEEESKDDEEEIITIGKKSSKTTKPVISVNSKKTIKEDIPVATNKTTKQTVKTSQKTVEGHAVKLPVKKSVNKKKEYPDNFDEWIKLINKSTLKTHDPILFRMVFNKSEQ